MVILLLNILPFTAGVLLRDTGRLLLLGGVSETNRTLAWVERKCGAKAPRPSGLEALPRRGVGPDAESAKTAPRPNRAQERG